MRTGWQSTVRGTRATAKELSKAAELEKRLASLEHMLRDLRDGVAALNKRTSAMQAQLDHVDARVGRR